MFYVPLLYVHPNDANDGALFSLIIETAKTKKLEPFAYLSYLFENLRRLTQRKR